MMKMEVGMEMLELVDQVEDQWNIFTMKRGN
jgi:hypothetical protein